MRCLYCNKKLSLLKMAKGDNFCSPEHFDAHQLQESKDAIKRLMNVPEDELAKSRLAAPQLIVSQVTSSEVTVSEERPAEPEEPAIDLMARLRQVEASTPDATVVQLAALKTPPYAAFTKSDLVPFPPEAVVNGADASEPVNAPGLPSFPVLGLENSACLLNLHRHVNLEETPPSDWKPSTRDQLIAPEDFPLDLARPSSALTPDPVEQKAEAPRVPAAVPSFKAPQPIHPGETRLSYQIAPSFLERTGAANFLDDSAISNPNSFTLRPILDPGSSNHDVACAMPKPAQFAENTAFKVQDSAHLIGSVPEIETIAAFIRPPAEQQADLGGWNASSPLAALTHGALETAWPSPRPETFDLRGPIPVRPEAVPSQHLDPAQILPSTSPKQLAIALFAGPAISEQDAPRAEEPGRIPPIALTAGAPSKRSMGTGLLFLEVLETSPCGREITFPDRQATATESGSQAVLAPFPESDPFSVEAWNNQPSHFTFPYSIAAAPALPPFLVKPRSAPPAPPELRSLIPVKIVTKPELVASTVLPVEIHRSFVAAPAILVARLDFPVTGTTTMPSIANIPPAPENIGLGTESAVWEPLLAAARSQPVVKFLPTRQGPVLLPARTWPRLGSLPS